MEIIKSWMYNDIGTLKYLNVRTFECFKILSMLVGKQMTGHINLSWLRIVIIKKSFAYF